MKSIKQFLGAALLLTTMSACSQAKKLQKSFDEATVKTKQGSGVWNGKRSAVVLTYDDALNVHLDHALPVLDSLGLKATFYLSGYSGAIHTRLAHWRAAAKKGHELGNHTLFHPCNGSLPGRSWVNADYDLSKYSIKRIEDEIRMTNTLLSAIDGREKRTFAYPCSDMQIGGTYYLKNIENQFTGARAVRTGLLQLGEAQLYNLPSFMVSGQTGDELIAQVKEAVQKGALLVFLFHGVGGEHNMDVSLPAHRQLLHYLKQNQKDIWIAPMTAVAEHIQAYRSTSPKTANH